MLVHLSKEMHNYIKHKTARSFSLEHQNKKVSVPCHPTCKILTCYLTCNILKFTMMLNPESKFVLVNEVIESLTTYKYNTSRQTHLN